MKKENNKVITILLVLIIIILSVLCILLATNTISFKNQEITNCSEDIQENIKEENNINTKNITKEKLQEIIEEQLFIFFNGFDQITKIEDIDNQSKLYLASLILVDKYITNSNEINTTIVSVEKLKLEEEFKSTVIGYLQLKHESFDTYELTSDMSYNNTYTMSKQGYRYHSPEASIIKNYETKDNRYIISMNYLFPDDNVGAEYYYGSLTDVKNETNSIVKASDDNGNYLNAQEYLENNYNNIKDKLATYTYVFEFKNDNLILTNFSIN
jgi:hypothetical protein